MIVWKALAVLSIVLGGIAPSLARDCRMPDAPPGVRVPKPLGCDPAPPSNPKAKSSSAVRASPQPGFIDLGNGGQIRIGGRVRVEAVTRH